MFVHQANVLALCAAMDETQWGAETWSPDMTLLEHTTFEDVLSPWIL